MLHDFHQPQVSLSDWQKFGTEVSPLIDELMDRVEADLPHWFVPFAPGVFVASDALLRTAGHRDGMRRPRGCPQNLPRGKPRSADRAKR
jgi:hypothetical protein